MTDQTITVRGLTFAVTHEPDTAHGAPWSEEDGHGPVTDWTSRDKQPGERVLCEDRGSRRYYDFAEAMKIAKRDGWGIAPERVAAWTESAGRAPTAAQIAEAAVNYDFARLRDWCADRWYYVGVCVELLNVDDEPTGETRSLWGIESDAGEYLDETAHELADEIAREVGRRKFYTRGPCRHRVRD